MLVLHGGPESSDGFICSPSKQQDSLLDEGTMLVFPSPQSHHVHTPMEGNTGPAQFSASLAQQSSLWRSQEQGLGRQESYKDRKSCVLEGYCIALVGGDSRREVGQGRGLPSFSKRSHCSAVSLGEPLLFCCQQAGAN